MIFITKWQDFSSNSQVVQRVVLRLNDADLLLPLVNDKIYCHVNFLITCMYQYGPEPAPTSRCFKKKRWETCCFFFFFLLLLKKAWHVWRSLRHGRERAGYGDFFLGLKAREGIQSHRHPARKPNLKITTTSVKIQIASFSYFPKIRNAR